MKEPSCHPFTTIQVDEEDKEVIDDDDSKLQRLRIDYGDSVCYAVKVASLMRIALTDCMSSMSYGTSGKGGRQQLRKWSRAFCSS
ncbi:hypothetical protein BRADI_2g03108v3 [Brachypodium distachyon]|uniref:Factor of DNA methylation 1-5/IDN2 domain-containing protein n=1 Tax=Brachypodium distachyon TaxID=15368 RepID=A0A2K2D6M7_BRADI|nr:hypothetical protein BRADI_2g03108v3 [Brachypodium distachyon]